MGSRRLKAQGVWGALGEGKPWGDRRQAQVEGCQSVCCPGGEHPGVKDTHEAAGLGQQRGPGARGSGRSRHGRARQVPDHVELQEAWLRTEPLRGQPPLPSGPYLSVHQQADGQRHVQAAFRDLGLHLSSKMQLGVVAQGAEGAVRKDRWGPDGVTWRGRAHVRGRVCATGPGQGWATASRTVEVKGTALNRGIRGTQPHEGGKGAPGLALWALQGLQAHGGQVPGKGHQGLTWPAR